MSKRKGVRAIAAGLLAMTLGLSACGGSANPTSNGSGTGSGDEIVIGAIQDLSGNSSVSGKAMDRGSKMAIDKINEAGGINGKTIKYVSYDTTGDPQEALNAYNRLVEQDKAVAVIGPPISNIGLALKQTAAEAKVPIVGAFIDSRVTMKDDGTPEEYMFLVQPTNQQSGEIQAGYLVEKLGIKKVALFYDKTNAFGVSQVEAFTQYIESHGGEITTEQLFKAGDVDFKVQLNKIKESGAEAIFAPNYPKDNTLYCTQMNQLGMTDLVTMGGLEFAPPFLTTLPDPTIVDNVYFAVNVAFDEPQLKDINDLYIATYDDAKTVDDISVKVYLGYDAVTLVAEAIKNAESLTGEGVKNALEGISSLEMLSGTFGFSKETHQPVGLSMHMYRIDKGQNVKLERYVPQD